MNFSQMCDVVVEHERVCECCPYNVECSKGVTGGPNGPYYPPCADCGYEHILNEDLVVETYRGICVDRLNERAPLPWQIEEDDLSGYVVAADGTKLFGGEISEGRVSATDPVIRTLIELVNSFSTN